MFLDSAKKKEIFEKYGKSATNTGSAESQIALFTVRIAHLTTATIIHIYTNSAGNGMYSITQ